MRVYWVNVYRGQFPRCLGRKWRFRKIAADFDGLGGPILRLKVTLK